MPKILDRLPKLCSWKLPPDSKIGQLQCVRERDHEGPHYVYVTDETGRKALYVYRVFPRKRGLRLVIHARLSGPITRNDVAALVELSSVEMGQD